MLLLFVPTTSANHGAAIERDHQADRAAPVAIHLRVLLGFPADQNEVTYLREHILDRIRPELLIPQGSFGLAYYVETTVHVEPSISHDIATAVASTTRSQAGTRALFDARAIEDYLWQNWPTPGVIDGDYRIAILNIPIPAGFASHSLYAEGADPDTGQIDGQYALDAWEGRRPIWFHDLAAAGPPSASLAAASPSHDPEFWFQIQQEVNAVVRHLIAPDYIACPPATPSLRIDTVTIDGTTAGNAPSYNEWNVTSNFVLVFPGSSIQWSNWPLRSSERPGTAAFIARMFQTGVITNATLPGGEVVHHVNSSRIFYELAVPWDNDTTMQQVPVAIVSLDHPTIVDHDYRGYALARPDGATIYGAIIGLSPGEATRHGITQTFVHEVGHAISLRHPHDDFRNGRLVRDDSLDQGASPMSYMGTSLGSTLFTEMERRAAERGVLIALLDRISSERDALSTIVSTGGQPNQTALREHLAAIDHNTTEARAYLLQDQVFLNHPRAPQSAFASAYAALDALDSALTLLQAPDARSVREAFRPRSCHIEPLEIATADPADRLVSRSVSTPPWMTVLGLTWRRACSGAASALGEHLGNPSCIPPTRTLTAAKFGPARPPRAKAYKLDACRRRANRAQNRCPEVNQ